MTKLRQSALVAIISATALSASLTAYSGERLPGIAYSSSVDGGASRNAIAKQRLADRILEQQAKVAERNMIASETQDLTDEEKKEWIDQYRKDKYKKDEEERASYTEQLNTATNMTEKMHIINNFRISQEQRVREERRQLITQWGAE